MLVTMTAVVVREPLQQLMTVGTGNAATFHVFLSLNLEFFLPLIISHYFLWSCRRFRTGHTSHFTPALRSGLKHHGGFICMTPLAPNGSEEACSDSCFLEHYLSLFLYNLLPPWWQSTFIPKTMHDGEITKKATAAQHGSCANVCSSIYVADFNKKQFGWRQSQFFKPGDHSLSCFVTFVFCTFVFIHRFLFFPLTCYSHSLVQKRSYLQVLSLRVFNTVRINKLRNSRGNDFV